MVESKQDKDRMITLLMKWISHVTNWRFNVLKHALRGISSSVDVTLTLVNVVLTSKSGIKLYNPKIDQSVFPFPNAIHLFYHQAFSTRPF